MNLFVYGTLKKGLCNHHLLGSAKFLGEFETKSKYRLFENGSFPMMWKDEDGYAVFGEVWKVDPVRVLNLDRHEALYHRELVDLKNLDKVVYGYIYDAWPDHRLTECLSGLWE